MGFGALHDPWVMHQGGQQYGQYVSTFEMETMTVRTNPCSPRVDYYGSHYGSSPGSVIQAYVAEEVYTEAQPHGTTVGESTSGRQEAPIIPVFCASPDAGRAIASPSGRRARPRSLPHKGPGNRVEKAASKSIRGGPKAKAAAGTPIPAPSLPGRLGLDIPDENAGPDERDQFLVRAKRGGMSYRDIKDLGRFPEAISTLRGRFRTLTKRKEVRVRQPRWQFVDVGFPRRYSFKLNITNEIWFYRSSCLKTPWRPSLHTCLR